MQMPSRTFAILLGLSLLIGSGVASAADESFDFAGSGPYLDIGVVQAWEQFDRPATNSRVGFDVAMGARFWRYLGAEIEFQAVPYWEIEGIEQSTYGITANAKGYLPIWRFQPYVLAGIGTIISEPNQTVGVNTVARLGYRFGVGTDVFVWRRATVSVSYGYMGNLADYGYTALYWRIGWHFAGD
jgi:opacity protein-like surface antigen